MNLGSIESLMNLLKHDYVIFQSNELKYREERIHRCFNSFKKLHRNKIMYLMK